GLDDLLEDLRGDLLVIGGLHGVGGAALGQGADVRGVTEHFGERDAGFDIAEAVLGFHALDLAAAAVKVTHDVALVFFRGDDFDLHDGLEEDRLGVLHGFLEGEDAGHLKGHFVRVYFVEGTEDDAGLEVDHRVTGDGAVVGGFEDAFGGGLDEFLGDDAADDLVDDFLTLLTDHAGGRRVGFELDLDVAILAAATRLADELTHAFGGEVDGFAVGNLGLAGLGLDLELALEAVDDDFEVKLTHAGDEGLARLRVGGDAEGRIFLGEALQADGETLLVTLGVGLDGHRDDGLGEGGLLEDQVVLGGEGVAGGDVLRADDRADVTGIGDVDFFAVHRTEEDDARDALVLTGARVVEGFALLELSAVHAVEDELADVRIGPELEAEAGDLRLVVRTDGDLLVAVVDEGLLGAHVDRGGQEVDDAV
ncbi:MAG: hypothetical protein AN484_25225, partial [Aphanizomenon flos-aquae WA102]